MDVAASLPYEVKVRMMMAALSSRFRGRSEAPSLQRVRPKRWGRRPPSLPGHASHFWRRRLRPHQWSPAPVHADSAHARGSTRRSGQPRWASAGQQSPLKQPFLFSGTLSDSCQPYSPPTRAERLLWSVLRLLEPTCFSARGHLTRVATSASPRASEPPNHRTAFQKGRPDRRDVFYFLYVCVFSPAVALTAELSHPLCP